MSKRADDKKFSPEHAGMQRTGPKRQIRPEHLGLQPWEGWDRPTEHLHISRWIEEFLIVPVGIGQGKPMKVARFQRQLLKRMCNALATFISISTGNGKTALMASTGLERLVRGDHYTEITVLATREEQARRLVQKMVELIESSPVLGPLARRGGFEFYKNENVLEYRKTGSKVTAYPATLSAIQGLNPDLTLIDEVAMVPSDLVVSMISRLVKKDDARVIGFGTPGFDDDNMLESLRQMAHSDDLPPGVDFVEYAADAGCDVMDAAQWRKANPAIGAGFLNEASLRTTISVMVSKGLEAQARAYHLGQPIGAAGPWLPHGAWDACIQADPPRDQTPVVLSVWGNYQRQLAIVGATLDGALFFGWQADKPSDQEVSQAIHQATEQWEVLEVCFKPHLRVSLQALLTEEGLPVKSWPADAGTDKESTAELYKTIVEGEVAHDHHPALQEQVPRLTAKVDNRGNPRLSESEGDVSAALAARAAWWRARQLAETSPTEDLAIF